VTEAFTQTQGVFYIHIHWLQHTLKL